MFRCLGCLGCSLICYRYFGFGCVRCCYFADCICLWLWFTCCVVCLDWLTSGGGLNSVVHMLIVAGLLACVCLCL